MLVHSIGQEWGPLDTEWRMRDRPITSMREYLRRQISG